MTSRINNPDTDADIALRQCIDTKTSFIMVAGAGSGKTTSLVKGLDYVAKTYGESLRQRRQKIACITYTTGAEKEILSDVHKDSLFHVSTIHSFLWELIQPFQSDIKQWVTARIKGRAKELAERMSNYGPRVQQKTKDKDQADLAKYLKQEAEMHSVTLFKYETGSNYKQGILGHSDVIKMVPELIEQKPLLKKIIIQRYPFFFIDESQDTLASIVSALVSVDLSKKKDFCLGFFGDPMQKIYVTGVGEITKQENWQLIVKPENFRCPTNVLKVINNIRKKGDGLEQLRGRTEAVDGKLFSVAGTARLFVLPADHNRTDNLLKIRQYISKENQDPIWLRDDADSALKVLVIEHRMAARRLKFESLYSAFKDNSSDSLSTSFSEGSSWALLPFQRFILPLVVALRQGSKSQIIELLKSFSPCFQKEYLKTNKITAGVLGSFATRTKELETLLSQQGTKIREVLTFVRDNELLDLDERISTRLDQKPGENFEGSQPLDVVMQNYFDCPVIEVWGYQRYINDESPFSTQHSIKGAEFERVLVVLDDEEGANSTLYSYEKLLGLRDPSERDNQNLEAGLESVFDRTRRLLYVCCSRSVKDLAVVLFVQDPNAAMKALEISSIFPKNSIYGVEAMK